MKSGESNGHEQALRTLLYEMKVIAETTEDTNLLAKANKALDNDTSSIVECMVEAMKLHQDSKAKTNEIARLVHALVRNTTYRDSLVFVESFCKFVLTKSHEAHHVTLNP